MTTHTITADRDIPNRHLVTRGATPLGIICKDICNGRIRYGAWSMSPDHPSSFVGRYDSIEEAADAIAATWPTEETTAAQPQPVRRTKADRRQLRATLRQRAAQTRATRKAQRAVATGTPQPARTHLVAAGLDDHTAKRFAGAFSRGVIADGTRETSVKLKGRTRKTVAVKLYAPATFAARLAAYRPKDKTAAARFEQAAHRLAA